MSEAAASAESISRARVRKVAAWALAAAIALGPVAWRIPVLPLSLTPTDGLLLFGVLLMAPAMLRPAEWREVWRMLQTPFPWLVCCVVSAASMPDVSHGARELLQLGFYVISGGWLSYSVCRDRQNRNLLGAAFAGAFILGAAGCLLASLPRDDSFNAVFGAAPSQAAGVLVSAALFSALFPFGRLRTLRWVLLGTTAAVLVLVALSSNPLSKVAGKAASHEAVPQRYLEAYAALGVVSAAPLTGVGLGDYQLHIGEFYQGMPKDNSMVPGTGIGYAILLASVGIPGLGAYCYWLHALWSHAKRRRRDLRWAVAAIAVAGCWTPILVSFFLLPLVVVHGMLASEFTEDA